MNAKSLIGWIGIAVLCLLPVFLLLVFGPSFQFNYSDITQKLGQIAALSGITAFALTFILSTRWKFIEDIFGGLDKVYIAHGILGGTALIMILFHPILLVLKFIPSNFYTAAIYLLPSSSWSVNFGIIAMTGFIALIYVTLYTKVKYHKWKMSHKFLGLVFIGAVLHMFLVRGDAARDYIFHGYYIYATAVSIIGLGGFSYSLLIKNKLLQEAIYKVESVKHINGVFHISFIPDRKPLEYKSGQFIFIRFYNEKLSKEPHPFSIASKSNSERLQVVVKGLGDFTSQLHHLRVGDKVSIEGPYGRFNSLGNPSNNKIWIAGGVGVVPFLGMAEESKDKKVKVDMYYTVSRNEDFISLDTLKSVAHSNKNFKLIPWVSSQKGHLTLETIKDNSGDLNDKEFYLCGPNALKDSIIRSLIKQGVSKNKIFQEDFNFR